MVSREGARRGPRLGGRGSHDKPCIPARVEGLFCGIMAPLARDGTSTLKISGLSRWHLALACGTVGHPVSEGQALRDAVPGQALVAGCDRRAADRRHRPALRPQWEQYSLPPSTCSGSFMCGPLANVLSFARSGIVRWSGHGEGRRTGRDWACGGATRARGNCSTSIPLRPITS